MTSSIGRNGLAAKLPARTSLAQALRCGMQKIPQLHAAEPIASTTCFNSTMNRSPIVAMMPFLQKK